MTSDFDCDLLVVGLGPVGDALATLAHLQGLSVVAIDRSPTIFPLPRAAVFDGEVMRIFQMMGIADAVGQACRVPDRYQFLTAGGEVLLDFPISAEGEFGWAETYALHQPAVEAALRKRMDELGLDLRTGVEFLAVEQDAAGVTATVRDADGTSSIRSRFLVGCDGSWSPVREALGIRLEDYAFDEPWLVLDTIIDEPGDMPVVCEQICDPRRPVTYMAMSGNRFRWEFMLKPGETVDEMLDDERIRELVEPWGCADRMTVERKAVYRFHALIAERWRAGRVMLAGDAAHQMPPFAGQGMCSGIRDAANLAWKIAAVVKGSASPDLLDTYQEEREPHVRAIIGTAIAMGRVVCLLDEDAAAQRDREMLARKASGAQDVSVKYPDLTGGMLTDTPRAGTLLPQPVAANGDRFDTLLGKGAALIGDDLPARTDDDVRLLDLGDPALRDFAVAMRRWLADAGAAAVLVRPDRHVFGTGSAAALLDQWSERMAAKIAA